MQQIKEYYFDILCNKLVKSDQQIGFIDAQYRWKFGYNLYPCNVLCVQCAFVQKLGVVQLQQSCWSTCPKLFFESLRKFEVISQKSPTKKTLM